MAEKTHVENLTELRALLVTARRKMVEEALFYRKQNFESPLDGDRVKSLQEQIEAVDRAIAEELRDEPSVYDRRGPAKF